METPIKRPPGRPQKYWTDKERTDAVKEQRLKANRKWREKKKCLKEGRLTPDEVRDSFDLIYQQYVRLSEEKIALLEGQIKKANDDLKQVYELYFSALKGVVPSDINHTINASEAVVTDDDASARI